MIQGKPLTTYNRHELENRVDLLKKCNKDGCKDHWINEYQRILDRDLQLKAPLPSVIERKVLF